MTLQGRSDRDELAEKIRETLARSTSVEKVIGKAGGQVRVLGCMLKFPRYAFNKNTSVSLAVRAQGCDGPDGCRPISPELKCNTSGVQFKHLATMRLPIYVRNVGRAAIIMCKKSNDGEWKEVKCQYHEDDGALVFQVQHLCTWGAWFRSLWPFSSSIMAENHLYFKRSPLGVQLCGITCIGEESIRTFCVQALKDDGFKNTTILYDKMEMEKGKEMKYKLEVTFPTNTQIQPLDEIVHGQQSIFSAKFLKANFHFSLAPSSNIKSALVDYTLMASNRIPQTSVLTLHWSDELPQHCQPEHYRPLGEHSPPEDTHGAANSTGPQSTMTTPLASMPTPCGAIAPSQVSVTNYYGPVDQSNFRAAGIGQVAGQITTTRTDTKEEYNVKSADQ